MIKEPRLRFTEEERADPALEKPIRKAEKAAAKADKAQAKIPKKQVKRTDVDPKTGKVTTKLVLEDKPRPPSKLSHSLRDAHVPYKCYNTDINKGFSGWDMQRPEYLKNTAINI